jgi:protein required for attachment to host cells
MQKAIVTVMNGMKARFLILDPAQITDYGSSPRLMEQDSLVNPAQETPGSELWSSTKPGRNRGSTGQAHSYDDHRDNHRTEFERRFAQTVGDRLITLIQAEQAQQLILIAEPHFLGLIRERLTAVLPKHLKLNELAKDLCQLKPHELQDYLTDRELLLAHQSP